ncbi:hypothetical protein AAY55_13815 [Vibrio metoecus]|uniref:K+ potassium transporter integral membrane domain-containing protein n=1 Tax=Vibrio metoecus TaxID=1481663 RepID=A0A0Q0KH68_VIBMT|nr:hypothetical protein AAY55_13815 [Vibrio metoecus]
MKPAKQTTASLAFLAMGIVYGDIGTSPLYAFKEVFFSHHPLAINPDKYGWGFYLWCFGHLS